VSGAARDLTTVDDVDVLVRAFYRRVATDDLLGPIFEGAGVDWSAHIPKLVDFWEWQLLDGRSYRGNPLRAHAPVHRVRPFGDAHYARWLELFDDTVDEHFAGPTAELAKERARRMASALQRLLDGHHGPGDEPTTVFGAPTAGGAGAPAAQGRQT
jgi:truncated hemoglobin YjbI